MEKLLINARFKVKEGQLKAFEGLVEKAIAGTATEPGCQQYDWFKDDEGTEFVVVETYDDADAVVAHVANVGPVLQEMSEYADFAADIYGPVSTLLVEALAGLEVRFYSHHGSAK